jgi:sugar O-acyltransferase (sialic acid O-acetyltransferase NeuD family)
MRDLLILGITPHAVEMAEMVARINACDTTWNLLGLVAPSGADAPNALADLPVVSFTDAQAKYPDACMVPVFEWPDKDQLPRERLVSIADPSVVIAPSAHIGIGSVLFPYCYVGAHARVGDFLFCLANTVINHDDVIGDYVTLTSGVMVAGDVHIESHCYLGQSSTVREFVRVGQGSLIGMGAVVLHDVPPNSVMVGNPARRSRAREEQNPVIRFIRRARRKLKKETAALLTRRREVPAASMRASERPTT